MKYTLLLAGLVACQPTENHPPVGDPIKKGPHDTDTADTAGTTDTSLEEVVGGNCGGPEPPEDSLWECNTGEYGPPWPSAGGPRDLESCLTLDGWVYTLSEEGNSVHLFEEVNGWELNCVMDN